MAAMLVATPAVAQPRPTAPAPTPPVAPAPITRRPVAVVNLDLTGNRQLLELATEISRALEAHPALRPLGLLAPLHERIDDPDAEQLARAQRKLAEAVGELANGNFPAAARAARDGQVELWSVTPTQAQLLYAELAFVRGKAFVGDGKPSDANASFSLSQRLDPRVIDTAREPPDVVAAYNAAKATSASTGRIEIATARGTVWIDGSEKGFAPNQYVVTSGLHVVWVTDRDRQTSGVEIDVKPGLVTPTLVPEVSASDTLKLQRARQELSRAPDDGARLVAMKQIARLGGVKDAVVLSLVDGTVVYQTWRSDDSDRSPGFSPKRERGPKDLPVKVLDDLVPPVVEDDPPGVEFPIPIDDTRWYEKPSYWAGIAFGTSLAAVGAYFLITALVPDTVLGPGDIGVSRPEDRVLR
ncbi:MAG: hypothetical protein ACKV2T_19035 [Kofleriaceae bacterium]